MFLVLIGALYGLDTNRFDRIRLNDDHPPHELTGKKMYFALSYQYEYESKCYGECLKLTLQLTGSFFLENEEC